MLKRGKIPRDVAASKHLENSPLCMSSAVIHEKKTEVLMVGDDSGNVVVYRYVCFLFDQIQHISTVYHLYSLLFVEYIWVF